jgi:hypothetical protein
MNGSQKPMLSTLVDLLAPVSFDEFLEVFRTRKRLHITALDRTRAESLFSWRDIDALLSGHVLDENVRILRDGVRVPRHLYTSNEGKQFNVRAFHDLLPQGVSIVVDDIHRAIPQISVLATAVERKMGIPTNVNAYLSFSKGGAFKAHWDIMDVLILQVHGKKHWRIWKAEIPYPVEVTDRGKVNTDVAPDQEIELAPGDILFIPRGEPHSAAVSADRSVHLTIGLQSWTGIDFLDHLRKQAARDPVLRMDLPRHSPHEQSEAHEAALKKRLHHLIDNASMRQYLLEDDLFRQPAPQTAVGGALPQIDDILRLSLRRHVPLPNISPESGTHSVMIGGETRRLSPAAVDIVGWLFDHDFATLRALRTELRSRYDHESIEAALRELYRLGFLV